MNRETGRDAPEWVDGAATTTRNTSTRLGIKYHKGTTSSEPEKRAARSSQSEPLQIQKEYTMYDKEKAEQKRRELQQTMKAGTQSLLDEIRSGKSERLLSLLAFSSKFHHYSPGNQWLIQLECMRRGITPNYVASYTTWQARGFQVRLGKGEKGIPIWQPKPYSKKDEETGIEKPHLSFTVAYVFADSQVEPLKEGAQIPTFFTPLQGDCEELCTRLIEVIRADGIAVSEVGDTAAAQGYSAKGRIGLKPGLDSTSKFLVLIHEYTHELLHPRGVSETMTKTVKECQAEATAYIVAHHFGVHNPYSSDYLQTWGNDEKSLIAEIEAVQRAASTIIGHMEKPYQDEKVAA